MGWLSDLWHYWTGPSTPAPQHAPQHSNRGDTWHMNPTTRIATNDRTHEIAYVAALVPAHDAQGHTTYHYEPIPEWVRNAHPGIRPFMPRAGHPMFAFDAGHGVQKDMKSGGRAIDFGCESSDHRFQEANITLNYANAAARKMNDRGGDVLITRTDPIYRHVDHQELDHAPYARQGFDFRQTAANNAFAGYVSFHVNHAENGEAQGTRLYADRRAPEISQSVQLLNLFRANARHEMSRAVHRVDPSYNLPETWDYIRDVTVNRPGFEMINGTKIPRTPSVLLEVGFISNPTDAANINSRNHIDRVTNELVSELWNFNELRAEMLSSPSAQAQVARIPGMAQVVREIAGHGRTTNNGIVFVEPQAGVHPAAPTHTAPPRQAPGR